MINKWKQSLLTTVFLQISKNKMSQMVFLQLFSITKASRTLKWNGILLSKQNKKIIFKIMILWKTLLVKVVLGLLEKLSLSSPTKFESLKLLEKDLWKMTIWQNFLLSFTLWKCLTIPISSNSMKFTIMETNLFSSFKCVQEAKFFQKLKRKKYPKEKLQVSLSKF